MKATFALSAGTPVFIVKANNADLSRVFGGTYLKQYDAWMYPAYPPLVRNVQNDFQVLGIELDESALEHLAKLRSYPEFLAEVKETAPLGPYENYAHQNEGVAELLYNYRWALRWEMGTGKTKVVIEALNKLQKKTLIIAPSVALDNWMEEIAVHSNGTLKAVILRGATRKKKLEVLSETIVGDCDVLVTTYDAARLYANQTLPASIQKIVKASRIPIPFALQKSLLGLPEKQALEAISEYQKLVPLSVIKRRLATLPRDIGLGDFPYEIIILDESHRIKNIRSKRTKSVMSLCVKAPRRYLLTGTMSMGNPMDLYTQMNALAKYLCPEDYMTYRKKFCIVSKYNEHIITGYKNVNVISRRINSVSSEKHIDDCVDLPELSDVDILFELSSEQLRDYNLLVNHVDMDFGEYGQLTKLHGGTRLNKLLQVCSGFLYVKDDKTGQVCDACPHVVKCIVGTVKPGTKRCVYHQEYKDLIHVHTLRYAHNPKLEALGDLLEDLLDNPEEKVVIWANLTVEMDDIAELLTKQKTQFVRVDGSSSSNIKNLVGTFNTDPNCRVYLGQESTGIAINLVAARYAVYYSRSWSLEHWLQSRAREYRIGQTRKTVIYRLCARNSVEVQQLIALDNKEDIAKMLTEKVSCALCDRYANCLKEKIIPWSVGCVYTSKIKRETVSPEVIKHGNYYHD
jgi:SNF2 family DNA or RNA helicase